MQYLVLLQSEPKKPLTIFLLSYQKSFLVAVIAKANRHQVTKTSAQPTDSKTSDFKSVTSVLPRPTHIPKPGPEEKSLTFSDMLVNTNESP